MKSTLGMLREERKGDKLSEREREREREREKERVTEKENKMHKKTYTFTYHTHTYQLEIDESVSSDFFSGPIGVIKANRELLPRGGGSTSGSSRAITDLCDR